MSLRAARCRFCCCHVNGLGLLLTLLAALGATVFTAVAILGMKNIYSPDRWLSQEVALIVWLVGGVLALVCCVITTSSLCPPPCV